MTTRVHDVCPSASVKEVLVALHYRLVNEEHAVCKEIIFQIALIIINVLFKSVMQTVAI